MKDKSIEFIQSKLLQEELLCQLAEECSELSQAALKLRRVYCGKNPTPIKRADAYHSILEEIADVALCIEVLELNTQQALAEIQKTINVKKNRWAMRLQDAEC